MDNSHEQEVDLTDVAVSDVLRKLTGDETMTLYGYCPGCREIHGDIHRLVEYLQFLSDQSMINFN